MMFDKCLSVAVLICIGLSNQVGTADELADPPPSRAAVNRGAETCVVYQARLQGPYLVVTAAHQGPWHSYAIDNGIRAEKKLAGRPSLGIEAPTEIHVEGIKTNGSWLQSEPTDMSQPELRWYRWGFLDEAHFAIKVDPESVDGPVRIRIKGQVCTEKHCQIIDLTLALTDSPGTSTVDIQSLIPVMKPADAQ